MANSKWLLWIGLFLCCTGIGTIGGIIMVAIYFYQDYTGKQEKYNKEDYADSTLREYS
jgi:TM2 domain-containing membrane protein YozV